MSRCRLSFPPSLVTLALLASWGAGCSSPDGPTATAAAAPSTPAADPQVVQLTPEQAARAGLELAPVARRRLEEVLATTGSVGFDETRLVHVSPRLAGRLETVPARLGQAVHRGQVLARIDSIELGKTKAEFLRSKARAELAHETYEREKGLFADRISSEQEMLAAQADWREAQAMLRATEETLHLYGLDQAEVESLHYDDPRSSIYEIRAPLDGKLVEKHATRGELVSPEDTLFLLADLARVWIWIDVYERDLPRVHLGDRVEARTDAWPQEVFRGEVTYLSDQVDADSRTVRARLDVENPGGRLRPGMFARVRLTDPHGAGGVGEAPRTLVVPASAVERDGAASFVFVALGGDRYERRRVHLGRRGDGSTEVTSGLEEGEQVVAEGAFLLKSEAAKDTLGGEE